MSHEPSRRVTGVIAAATALACFVTLASWAYAASVTAAAASGAHSMNFAALTLSDAYRVAPALILGLALALSLPLVAVFARAVRYDNDIRISNASVHRYHAAIHREDYNDWHITDLSGVEGNGLIVNGRHCCEARLNDGDLIQLGPGRLRFRDGQV